MQSTAVKMRINITNIVFATDLTESSYSVLPFAEEFARYYGAKVWAFHVLTPSIFPFPPSPGLPGPEKDEQEIKRELDRELENRLVSVSREVVIAHGDIWSALSDFIKKNNVDLVVMSTHGRMGLGKALLGSVAETVFRQCPCPVLTVGPNVAAHLDQPVGPTEILYATDLAPDARTAAVYAASIAQEYQARLVLLHAIESPATGEFVHGGEFVNATMELLRGLVPPDTDLWCRPEYLVKFGSPADSILEVARRRNAHLIVLGVRRPEGRIGFTTHFARATAYQVVSRAECPVLTVCG